MAGTHPSGPTHRLVREHRAVAVPELDAQQRAVVDHREGPLLVLAGPGTGKTTTLVEAVVDRLSQSGVRPEHVLALTFSRKAAEQLRDRVTARLGRTLATGLSSTFHSFAYALVRHHAPADIYAAPLRLLSAPEQDVVLRELLTDAPESVTWPESLRRALGTRGFAREVNAVLSRAREKGLDGDELLALGAEHGLPELRAAGLFLEQYLTTLDHLGATDYADLIRRATIEAAAHRDELRARYRYVFVDEYQDTDPGQVALLRQLAGDGGNLVVVGDPHQSIYGFRGAEVRGILDFPAQFPRADGRPAEVVALRTTRRFGPHLLLASQRVASRLALPGSIPEAARQAFLEPRSDAPTLGKAEVLTFDTERAEAEHLADLLRRAHLEQGLDWSDMAVLVRSGRSTLPPLRRALGAAGVPVEVSHDEVPLVRDPAVLPLLDAVRAVVNLDNADPDHVDFVHASRAESLLLSPLGGLDAGQLRRLGRQLRTRARVLARDESASTTPPTSRDLLRSTVVEAGFLDGLEGPEVERARALSALLHGCRAELDGGASAEEVLWHLWSGTRWPERLRRAVELGGGAARRAHRDLDSICALFEAVARAEEQRVHLGVADLFATLAAQQIPADTLAERGARGAAVRLLTAHRSKGLEWPLVVVAHVQQESWPDLRRRASLLQPDRIGEGELVPPVSSRELLLEERRLFYVASTRARERLVVTAVASPDDEGEQPSRFLEELGVPVTHRVGRPPRPLSLAGLVGDLRRTLADPETPEPLRDAAARRLARLAGETVGTRRLVPQADPASWWGTRSRTWSTEPVRESDQPVPVSASVLEHLMVCPTQWFLAREAGGVARSHQAANLGQLVHALAERVARGDLDAGVDGVEVLMAHVDEVWDRLEFRTPWAKEREHQRTRAALARFLRWHHTATRTLVGVEQSFSAVVDVPDPTVEPGGAAADDPTLRVRLTGYADRVEVDADGAVVVVDLKTNRSMPTGPAVAQHRQLALYQYAVDAGAADQLVPDGRPARSGGAQLVQLGSLDDRETAVVQTQDPPSPDGPERRRLRGEIGVAATLLRTEQFPAVPGPHCRDCDFVPVCPARSAGSVTA
ncbi:ATP-dependent helicase [Nocardioides litoris]|uniref:ATP-dependent helicase n=1 Tax=Nocardioides litoris TaxID=1926648 RepID=UPI00111CEB03|nr:ATP-dependent DNA helicase [Nocardioides litoris]